MARGPGEYDAEATEVRERTDAMAVVVMVLGGNKGSGFSVQVERNPRDAKKLLAMLPQLLRSTADEIEKDLPKV